MRRTLSFVPLLLILLSIAAIAQGGPIVCPAAMTVPKSCYGNWDFVAGMPLPDPASPLPFVPSLIVANLTHGKGTGGFHVDRPYQQIVLRTLNDKTYTTIEGAYAQCKFTLQLKGKIVSLEKSTCTTLGLSFEYTLIP